MAPAPAERAQHTSNMDVCKRFRRPRPAIFRVSATSGIRWQHPDARLHGIRHPPCDDGPCWSEPCIPLPSRCHATGAVQPRRAPGRRPRGHRGALSAGMPPVERARFLLCMSTTGGGPLRRGAVAPVPLQHAGGASSHGFVRTTGVVGAILCNTLPRWGAAAAPVRARSRRVLRRTVRATSANTVFGHTTLDLESFELVPEIDGDGQV